MLLKYLNMLDLFVEKNEIPFLWNGFFCCFFFVCINELLLVVLLLLFATMLLEFRI